MTVQKNDLIIDLFIIMKDAKSPMSQSDIINALKKKGYKYTVCATLFSPSVLQPVWVVEEGVGSYSKEPLILKANGFSNRPLFILSPLWRKVSANEAKKKLNHFDGNNADY